MCAIFGIYGEYNKKLIEQMSVIQRHRGPDETTFYFNKRFKLSIGMNRLAVIDKKNGKQPMFSWDKKILCLFNGTIYNFQDLKKFLEKKTLTFIQIQTLKY